ncbi:MAG: hypothetical protein AAFW81_00595 [Pseudomonadota bacterium]
MRPPATRRARLRIAEIGARGDGVADLDGETVYIPYTAPDDLVEASIAGSRGEIVDLIEPGASRAEPFCPLFGACGGCALQHLDKELYADWKRKLLIDALVRAGLGDAPVGDLIRFPNASRRRASLAVKRTQGGLCFGFNRLRSEKIVDVGACPVLAPELQSALPGLRALSADIPLISFDLNVTLCDNGIDVDIRAPGGPEIDPLCVADLAAPMGAASVVRTSLNGEPLLTLAAPFVLFGGARVTPPPGGFLQASREGEAALINLVRDAIGEAGRIADLFSGCGTFALSLDGASVDAFDADAAAIAALDAAARAAGRRFPIHAEARNLFDRPLVSTELAAYDAVVIDPPRAGAAAQARELARSEVPTIVSVSCNPASFARDAAILHGGGYALSHTRPVDQFAYAAHLEMVGVFKKAKQ